jgi:hypothetical protein
MTPPDLLETAGRALFGEYWQRATARLLGFASDNSLRKMLAGQLAIKPGIFEDLERELERRIGEMKAALAALRKAKRPRA